MVRSPMMRILRHKRKVLTEEIAKLKRSIARLEPQLARTIALYAEVEAEWNHAQDLAAARKAEWHAKREDTKHQPYRKARPQGTFHWKPRDCGADRLNAEVKVAEMKTKVTSLTIPDDEPIG